MAGKKKQHYVPQFYLSFFTEDGDHLFVYDKFKREIRPDTTLNVGHENYFYELPSKLITDKRRAEGIHEKYIEDRFAELEGRFKPIIEKAINLLEDQFLSEELVQALAVVLTFQILRTRDMRNQIIEGERAYGQALIDSLMKLNFPDLPKGTATLKVTEGFEAFIHAQHIFDEENIREMAESLSKMIWVVAVNKTNQPFYTSDNPVVKDNHIKEIGKRGWLSPGVEINFPLNPNRLLLIYERTHFKDYEKADGCIVTLTEVDEVNEFNRYQVINSHRQIYSINNDFSLAENVCDELSEICKPREKIEVQASELIKTDDPNKVTQIISLHSKDDIE
ncbi:MAG: DUF4238 domain-containing protein [Acidobacteriota bacterium]